MGWLIAARVVQGAGAALVMPLAVALLSAGTPPERRGRALGTFEGLTGLATIAGPPVGGAIAQLAGWEWIFWVNVPIAVLMIPLVVSRVRESHGADTTLDIRGMSLLTGGALGLVWGLVRGNESGWTSPEVVAALGAGTVLLLAPMAGALADRVGNRPALAGGLGLQAAGLAWIAVIAAPDVRYGALVLPLVLNGIGASMATASLSR